jgi:hypothetical protein
MPFGCHHLKHSHCRCFWCPTHSRCAGSVQIRRFPPQVVREALTKDYAAMAYDQPYQRALYSGGQLQEARKWHVDDYSAVIGGLSAADLQVCCGRTLIEQLGSRQPTWALLLPEPGSNSLRQTPMLMEAAHAWRRVVAQTPCSLHS